MYFVGVDRHSCMIYSCLGNHYMMSSCMFENRIDARMKQAFDGSPTEVIPADAAQNTKPCQQIVQNVADCLE